MRTRRTVLVQTPRWRPTLFRQGMIPWNGAVHRQSARLPRRCPPGIPRRSCIALTPASRAELPGTRTNRAEPTPFGPNSLNKPNLLGRPEDRCSTLEQNSRDMVQVSAERGPFRTSTSHQSQTQSGADRRSGVPAPEHAIRAYPEPSHLGGYQRFVR